MALRLAIGAVWLGNLLFVVDPSNDFFGGFSRTALGFAGSTLTGPDLATLTARYAVLVSGLIAAITAYLAVAFLLGWTTRVACVVGGIFSVVLLVTQWGATFAIPGGTDVGPHPLYIAVYAALLLGRSDRLFSVDAHWDPFGTIRRWWGGWWSARAPVELELARGHRADR